MCGTDLLPAKTSGAVADSRRGQPDDGVGAERATAIQFVWELGGRKCAKFKNTYRIGSSIGFEIIGTAQLLGTPPRGGGCPPTQPIQCDSRNACKSCFFACQTTLDTNWYASSYFRIFRVIVKNNSLINPVSYLVDS